MRTSNINSLLITFTQQKKIKTKISKSCNYTKYFSLRLEIDQALIKTRFI